jgi:general stress protein 26
MKNICWALLVARMLAPAASVATQDTTAPTPTRAQILQAAIDLMRAARYCTFITVDDGGQPQARVVDPFLPEQDMTVWVATRPVTRKVAQIRKNPRVTLLCFDAAKQGYVTLLGTAALVDDAGEKAKRWKPEWKAFYEDENRGQDYMLIRVKPTRLEILSPAHGLGNDPRTWQPVSLELK